MKQLPQSPMTSLRSFVKPDNTTPNSPISDKKAKSLTNLFSGSNLLISIFNKSDKSNASLSDKVNLKKKGVRFDPAVLLLNVCQQPTSVEDPIRTVSQCLNTINNPELFLNSTITPSNQNISGINNIFSPHQLLTPLHVACSHGNVEIVKLLLEAGSFVNVYDSEGWTPLHCAAAEGHIEILNLLGKCQGKIGEVGLEDWIYVADGPIDLVSINEDGDMPIDVAFESSQETIREIISGLILKYPPKPRPINTNTQKEEDDEDDDDDDEEDDAVNTDIPIDTNNKFAFNVVRHLSVMKKNDRCSINTNINNTVAPIMSPTKLKRELKEVMVIVTNENVQNKSEIKGTIDEPNTDNMVFSPISPLSPTVLLNNNVLIPEDKTQKFKQRNRIKGTISLKNLAVNHVMVRRTSSGGHEKFNEMNNVATKINGDIVETQNDEILVLNNDVITKNQSDSLSKHDDIIECNKEIFVKKDVNDDSIPNLSKNDIIISVKTKIENNSKKEIIDSVSSSPIIDQSILNNNDCNENQSISERKKKFMICNNGMLANGLQKGLNVIVDPSKLNKNSENLTLSLNSPSLNSPTIKNSIRNIFVKNKKSENITSSTNPQPNVESRATTKGAENDSAVIIDSVKDRMRKWAGK
jgi:hypothetical protein